MRPSREVITEFVDDPRFVKIKSLDSPWSQGRTFLCESGPKKIVLKNWHGPSSFARLTGELVISSYLNEVDTSIVARHALTFDGKLCTEPRFGYVWTAYNYLAGRQPMDDEKSDRVAIANNLATYHNAYYPRLLPTHQSRLPSLPARIENLLEVFRAPPSCVRGSLLKIRSVCNSHLAAFLNLPKALIHGDYRYENIRIHEKTATAFDLEFAREDVRILDIGSLLSGERLSDGRFASPKYEIVAEVFRRYAKTVYPSPSISEQKLLGVAAVLSLAIVFVDLLEAGRYEASHAAAAIEEIATTRIYGEIDG